MINVSVFSIYEGGILFSCLSFGLFALQMGEILMKSETLFWSVLSLYIGVFKG